MQPSSPKKIIKLIVRASHVQCLFNNQSHIWVCPRAFSGNPVVWAHRKGFPFAAAASYNKPTVATAGDPLDPTVDPILTPAVSSHGRRICLV